MLNKIFTILVIFNLIYITYNQSVPFVPCPDIFSYVLNSQNGQIEGRITISDTQTGIENLVLLRMTYPSNVINHSPGMITPVRNFRDIVKDIQQNRPVIYRIVFPTLNPLPTVNGISSNGKLICSNSDGQGSTSTIVLHFKLSVPNIRVNTNNNRVIQQNSIRKVVQQKPRTKSNSNSCGVSDIIPSRLIVGGVKMQPGTWPWLASLFMKSSRGQFEYICGATIIAPHAVLTAAHCVVKDSQVHRTQDILVGLGLFEIYKWDEPNTHVANVNNIIPHVDYGNSNKLYDADVAILVLTKSYSYNYRIRPICMWSGSNDINQIVSQQAYVVGWGIARPDGSTEQQPNIVETEIVSTDRCRTSNSAISNLISNRNFCAGYLNGHGPCKGDSGSGLMIDINGKWYLRGIVSGAIGHIKRVCDLNQYVIYTDAAKFTRWINAQLNIY